MPPRRQLSTLSNQTATFSIEVVVRARHIFSLTLLLTRLSVHGTASTSQTYMLVNDIVTKLNVCIKRCVQMKVHFKTEYLGLRFKRSCYYVL